MTDEALPAALLLLVLAGAALDVMVGRHLRHRGRWQAALAAVILVAALGVPTCSTAPAPESNSPAEPYRF